MCLICMRNAFKNLRLRRKIEKILPEKRRRNDMNEFPGPHTVRFTHACGGCGSDAPAERYASVACGHAVCRECAGGADEACPLCFAPTSFVRLFNDEEHSRECEICFCGEPFERSFMTACGHVFCSACSLNHLLFSLKSWIRFCCPICRAETNLRTLREETVEVAQVADPDSSSTSTTDSDAFLTSEKRTTSLLRKLICVC